MKLLYAILLTTLFLLQYLLTHAQTIGWSEVGEGSDSIFNLPGYGSTAIIKSLCTDKYGNVYAAGFLDAAGNNKWQVAKWDGNTWSQVGTLNANGGINSVCVDTAGNIYAGGYFTDGAAETSGNVYVAKWDGVAWTELGGIGGNPLLGGLIQSLCADNAGNIYAAGGLFFWQDYTALGMRDSFASLDVAKWDGNSWSWLGKGTTSYFGGQPLGNPGFLNAVCADKNNIIYTGGVWEIGLLGDSGWAASFDNGNWSIHSGLTEPGPTINAMCTDADGNLYVAGAFTDVSGFSYVAKYSAGNWNELGTGSSALNANNEIKAICFDKPGNLYAAGGFTDSLSDGLGWTYVAKWDGTGWSHLGTDSSYNGFGNIYSLCADISGNIYAGGNAFYANQNSASSFKVARYGAITTGIKSPENALSQIKIYPNPFTNEFHIQITGDLINSYYTVYDCMGNKVYSGVFTGQDNAITLNNAPGMFFIHIENSTQSVYKIIKLN